MMLIKADILWRCSSFCLLLLDSYYSAFKWFSQLRLSKAIQLFMLFPFFPSQMILLSDTVSCCRADPPPCLFFDYRGDLHHERLFCEWYDTCLFFNFPSCYNGFGVQRDSWSNCQSTEWWEYVVCQTISGDRWSACFRTSNPEMWFEDPDKYGRLKCQWVTWQM